MNKLFSYALVASIGLLFIAPLSSCNHSEVTISDDEQRDKAYQEIAETFVNKTVVPTYTKMAQKTVDLVEDLRAYRKAPTQENLIKACEDFIESRGWWERSEAFLFGAANDFGIDPHIDSWPLDLPALQKYLEEATNIKELDGEDSDIVARTKLGQELLGFHGVEYILFENGKPRTAGTISEEHLIYAIAVAGDLRNSCWQLLTAWAGEEYASKLNKELVKHILEDVELPVLVGGRFSYGENMVKAGQPGSLYRSWINAMEDIVSGCNGICDEVGTSKIGKAHTGEDASYIESPYSQRSILDFHDNIISVENVYLGGIEGNRGASLHQYMQKHNKEMDAKVLKAIDNAKNAIKSMKAPFVLNYTDAGCKTAMDACKALDETLSELKQELAKK
ncbi:imelysin [Porphyromonas sp. CAG:1061]|uniref:imelysin family protein n=1 Tax=Porphyromonas sp. CAG:1061 TaxID=1262916 RepID=UPI000334E434|nr:imelysin family protein [Porphyromonas sp. CAG:1061]CCY09465.1 imelysin [Porphyromonas sp. CAG:1061]